MHKVKFRLLHACMVMAFLVAAQLSCMGVAEAQAPTRTASLISEPPRAVLFIGNSFFRYNGGLHEHVAALVRGAQTSVRADFRSSAVTISGAGFIEHDVESYFQSPEKIVGNSGKTSAFDAAVMMDCSICPIDKRRRHLFPEYARRHIETVRRHGVRPVLFMTWAYSHRPEMIQQLAEAYTLAGVANNVPVVPAGLAFASASVEMPGLQLYTDQRHPSLAGTYLAAATTYATLFGRSPLSNTGPHKS